MSMRTAITGLSASQIDLSTIANNIANAATTGFKASRTEFANMVSADGGGTSPGSGVRVTGVVQQFRQGGLEYSGNALDLAINGTGFFVLKDAGGGVDTYTRVGSFTLDKQGYVASSTGQKLLFKINTTGLLATPTSTSYDSTIQASATRFSSVVVNDTPVVSNKTLTIGGTTIALAPRNEGTAADRAIGLATDINNKVAAQTPPIKGLRASVDPADATKVVVTYSGAEQVKLENIAAASTAVSPVPVTRLEFSALGELRATYEDGAIATLGTVALATFPAPTKLMQMGDTRWGETESSGTVALGVPGAGERGLIESGMLEASNVEITEQLVDMITAQRNFQANAKTITTADQVAQAVLNIR